ncbi:hypothetical protein ABDK00_014335 [Niabella insulamsoli]|uniref:hypothetical protein n=1 Tax=Niabella insulamsoli TaxID=3144874 RepID=UPI0031FCC5D0
MGIRKFFERLSNWELWNFYVLYAPITPVWFWYCLRSRAFWFFTASNPTITFGGFEGEGKKEMYALLPPELAPQTLYIESGLLFSEVLSKMEALGIRYPFVVKPDVGMKGIMFRIIEDEAQLERYHDRMPVEYIIQEKIDLPEEVSVFYYRYPWEQRGTVSGFIHKELLQVKGDGKSTLKALIEAHPRAKHRFAEMELMHGHRFDRVIDKDDIFYLSFAGNHNRGAKFINLDSEIDDTLVAVFDKISHHAQFFYGRYDIKIKSVNDLKAGRNFIILEYNGAGAEPNHIYDSGLTIWQAYRTILQHWKALYKISKYNAAKGSANWPFKKGLDYLKAARRHFAILEKYE